MNTEIDNQQQHVPDEPKQDENTTKGLSEDASSASRVDGVIAGGSGGDEWQNNSWADFSTEDSGYHFRFRHILLFIVGLFLGFLIDIFVGSFTFGFLGGIPVYNMILILILNMWIVRLLFKQNESKPIAVGLLAFFALFLLVFGQCFFMVEAPKI